MFRKDCLLVHIRKIIPKRGYGLCQSFYYNPLEITCNICNKTIKDAKNTCLFNNEK